MPAADQWRMLTPGNLFCTKRPEWRGTSTWNRHRFEGHQANSRGWLDLTDVAGRRTPRRPDDAGTFASTGVRAMKPHPLTAPGWCPVLKG